MNVGVALGAVTVGIVTTQLDACVPPLYTSGNVQVGVVLPLNDALFPLAVALNVTAFFLVIAYHVFPVLLLVSVKLPVLVL